MANDRIQAAYYESNMTINGVEVQKYRIVPITPIWADTDNLVNSYNYFWRSQNNTFSANNTYESFNSNNSNSNFITKGTPGFEGILKNNEILIKLSYILSLGIVYVESKITKTGYPDFQYAFYLHSSPGNLYNCPETFRDVFIDPSGTGKINNYNTPQDYYLSNGSSYVCCVEDDNLYNLPLSGINPFNWWLGKAYGNNLSNGDGFTSNTTEDYVSGVKVRKFTNSINRANINSELVNRNILAIVGAHPSQCNGGVLSCSQYQNTNATCHGYAILVLTTPELDAVGGGGVTNSLINNTLIGYWNSYPLYILNLPINNVDNYFLFQESTTAYNSLYEPDVYRAIIPRGKNLIKDNPITFVSGYDATLYDSLAGSDSSYSGLSIPAGLPSPSLHNYEYIEKFDTQYNIIQPYWISQVYNSCSILQDGTDISTWNPENTDIYPIKIKIFNDNNNTPTRWIIQSLNDKFPTTYNGSNIDDIFVFRGPSFIYSHGDPISPHTASINYINDGCIYLPPDYPSDQNSYGGLIVPNTSSISNDLINRGYVGGVGADGTPLQIKYSNSTNISTCPTDDNLSYENGVSSPTDFNIGAILYSKPNVNSTPTILPTGDYIILKDGEIHTVSINSNGEITSITLCPPPSTVISSSSTEIPEYIEYNLSLKTYLTYNYIDWEQFPDITEKPNLWIGYGHFPQFNTDISGSSTLNKAPAPIRKGYANTGYIAGYAGGNVNQLFNETSVADLNNFHLTDPGWANNYGASYVADHPNGGAYISTFLYDNELEYSEEYLFIHYSARGGINAALNVGNTNFKFIDYNGKDLPGFTKFSNYYYSEGTSNLYRTWWPYMDKTAIEATRTLNSGYFFTDLQYPNHNYLRTIDNYLMAGLPDDISLYQKDGNGKIKLDAWGNRLLRLEDITATLRGETFTLKTLGDRDENGIIIPCNGGYQVDGGYCMQTTLWIFYIRHQSWRAINSLSSVVAQNISTLIARNKKQFNTNDISEYRSDVTWDYVPITRDGTETRPWGTINWQSHPISNYQINVEIFQALILFGRVQLWNGHGNVAPVNMGTAFTAFEVNESNSIPFLEDQSIVANITAVFHYCHWLADNKNMFSNNDKILVFMEPSEVQDGEIIAVGRMNGNNVFIILAEPRLDIGETMTVTITNTKNNFTHTEIVQAREMSKVLITLPNDTYTSKDIIISYINTRNKDNNTNTVTQVTGDLNYHTV